MNKMKAYFLITTQYIENYGAHCESGKFSDGSACWKFKNGQQYVVSYTTTFGREANAVAFMTSYLHKRNARVDYKEIVRDWEQIHESQIAALDHYKAIDIDDFFHGANSEANTKSLEGGAF